MPLERRVLEDDFIRLEPVIERHRAELRVAGDDPDLWRFAVINPFGADFDAWFDDRLTKITKAGDLTFVVIDKASGEVAGSSSYLEVSLPHRRLEIGWTWYARKFWASVVNPSCKYLMMSHGFDQLGLNRIEFKLDESNERSFRAVERLGAKFEGVRRSHVVMPDGRRRNSAYFSVLKEEWPTVRENLLSRLDEFASLPTPEKG